MGAESSKGSKSRELPKLEAPPGGLSVITPQNAKLTGTEPTTFRMPPSWWTGALQTVRDVYSDEVLFGTQSRPPAAGGIKAVFNPNGTMAFGLRQVHASLTLPPHILVSPTGQEVCKIFVDSGAAKAVVRSRVLDYAHGGDPVIIHFIFKWSCKTGTMYAGDPKQGGIPFANVSYSLPGVEKSAKGEYFLAVAPGVDKGICIALCIALADTQNC